jgi:hypothetical protein
LSSVETATRVADEVIWEGRRVVKATMGATPAALRAREKRS